jgi:hypothetical protein
MLAITILLVTLNILDIATTMLCLSTGKLFELNTVGSLSPTFLSVKILVCFMFLPFFWLSDKYLPKIFNWIPFSMMVFASGYYVTVVLGNLVNYLEAIT